MNLCPATYGKMQQNWQTVKYITLLIEEAISFLEKGVDAAASFDDTARFHCVKLFEREIRISNWPLNMAGNVPYIFRHSLL